MNLPRDPSVIWSKSTQTMVGLVVGCIAAAAISSIPNPVAADQRVGSPKVTIVTAVTPDEVAAEPVVAVEEAAIILTAAVTKPAPAHDQVPRLVPVQQGAKASSAAHRTSAPTSAPAAPAATSAPPPPPTQQADAPPPPEPAAPPPPEPKPEKHHKPPKPPKG